MDNLQRQLKLLRAIEPDRDFALRAKMEILRTAPNETRGISLPSFIRTLRTPAFAWSGFALTAVLIVVVVGTPILFPKPTMSASLSADTLLEEYNSLPINIQLKEISYDQTVNQTVSSAISEVSDTKTKHLNSELINSEANKVAPVDATTSNVDSLLDQAINN